MAKGSVSEYAHRHDLREMEEEARRRDDSFRKHSPNAWRCLEAQAPIYVALYRRLGSRDPLVQIHLEISDYLLDEMWFSRDIPQEEALMLLRHLEDREACL